MTELTGIGAELRRARESQGLAVADVAQQLKFASRQIESLENERFDRLPGPTIARGMVRNYARLLNLDPEPLVERMSPSAEPPPDAARRAVRFQQPVPFSDSGRRSTLVYAGFSVAVLALVGVVAYEWQQERAAPQFITPAQPQLPPQAPQQQPEPAAPPLAENRAPLAQKKPAPAREQEKLAAAETKAAAPAAPAPAVETKPAVEKKPAAEEPAPETAAAAPAAAEEPLKEATGDFHRIELICREESWLEVKDGTGRSLVSSLNPAGSERLVRGRGPFEIVVGNARGVTLIVDGKPVDLKPHTRIDVARLTIP